MTRRRTGPYLVQTAIADLHLQEPRDWPQIAVLYETRFITWAMKVKNPSSGAGESEA